MYALDYQLRYLDCKAAHMSSLLLGVNDIFCLVCVKYMGSLLLQYMTSSREILHSQAFS